MVRTGAGAGDGLASREGRALGSDIEKRTWRSQIVARCGIAIQVRRLHARECYVPHKIQKTPQHTWTSHIISLVYPRNK